MSWTREFNLFFNVDLEPGLILLKDKTGQAAANRPEWVGSDCFTVNIWPRKPSGTTGVAATAVQLDPTDRIVLSGKVGAAGTLLFSATEFEASGEGDDLCYKALLDLNQDALTTVLRTLPSSQQSIIVVGEIEVRNLANTQRLSGQFDLVIRRQVYAGEGAPTPAAPVYPLPQDLALKTPVNGAYRVKEDETGSYMQVKNKDTGSWHTLFVAGPAGAEGLTIGPAEA